MEKVTLASKRRRGVSCRTQGGLPPPAHRPCFFRVRFVVARLAQAHQIVVYIRKFRVFIHMLDVMNDDRRDGFSIPCAPPATVSVAPLYEFRFSFPFLAVVIKIHCRTFNEYGPPCRADRRKSFMLCELLRAGAGYGGSSRPGPLAARNGIKRHQPRCGAGAAEKGVQQAIDAAACRGDCHIRFRRSSENRLPGRFPMILLNTPSRIPNNVKACHLLPFPTTEQLVFGVSNMHEQSVRHHLRKGSMQSLSNCSVGLNPHPCNAAAKPRAP